MIKSFVILIGLLIFTSCSSIISKSPKIFSDGTYFHNVKIDIIKGPKFNFTGINRISNKKFNVVALGTMGNTLIDYEIDLTTKIESINYDKNFFPIPKNKIEDLVHLLHRMYSLTENICEKHRCMDELHGFQFEFRRNKLGFINKIKISRENVMTVNVDVTKYKK